MTYIADIPRCGKSQDDNKYPTRIVGSNRTIPESQIKSVLEKYEGELRGTVEHVLAALDHTQHPNSKLGGDRYSPNAYIDTPKSALEILEILLSTQKDIFSTREDLQAQKIALSIVVLLSEYYGNQEFYSSGIRSPEEQIILNQAQQRITDTFHFIIGNIIDKKFQVNPQYGELSTNDIIQKPEVLNKLERGSEFPNVREALQFFRYIDFDEPKQAA